MVGLVRLVRHSSSQQALAQNTIRLLAYAFIVSADRIRKSAERIKIFFVISPKRGIAGLKNRS